MKKEDIYKLIKKNIVGNNNYNQFDVDLKMQKLIAKIKLSKKNLK